MKLFTRKLRTTHYYDNKQARCVATVLKLEKTVIAKVEKKADNYLVYYALVSDSARPTKPVAGQYKGVKKISRVVTGYSQSASSVNSEIKIELVAVGDKLEVRAKTKGKGFAGTVKRHGFNTGPRTHGSHNYRRPGSIGDTGPQRVLKGKKMAGHMGAVNIRLKNIPVVRVDSEKNEIWLKGHIPGPAKSIVVLEKKESEERK